MKRPIIQIVKASCFIALRSVVLLSVVSLTIGSACIYAQPVAIDESNVAARFTYTPHASQAGVGELTLELRDSATQQPLDYTPKRLAGWLQKQPKALVENDAGVACSDKVRALASQGIGRRAAVDFNTYSLVTINSDRTVAFINPFLKLNNAKLEGVVSLPGDATAHLHHKAARELWVVMRDSDAIAVIDTDTRQLKRNIQFAAGSKPLSLVLMGNSLWVSFAGRDSWLRFDGSASETPDAKVDATAGAQLYANATGNSLLGAHAKGVTLLSADKQSTRNFTTSSNATAAVWSDLSKRWLVASSQNELVLLGEDGDAKQRITLDAPAAQLITFDAGRYAIASMPSRASVAIIDVATASALQTVSVTPDATELALSNAFAYVHSATRGQATLLSLPDARQGKAKPVHISIGTPGSNNDLASINSAITVNTPDSMSMLIANPQDGQIYQYAEGMMAPIGSFSNYKRSAQALVLLNHGFESLGNGRYRATVRHTQGGPHELVLSGVQPRFASCLKVALPEVPNLKREALAARPQATLLRVMPSADDAIAVEVKLEDKTNRQPVAAVRDLVLLAFDKRSGWQRRVPLTEQAPGLYVAKLPTKEAVSKFELLVSSATQDMPFGDGLIGAHELNKGVSP